MPSKILIIEDDPNAAELARLYLTKDGHEVLSALDGAEGLRLALDEAPISSSSTSCSPASTA